MAYWDSYPKSGPRRPAKDGIVAKTKRGAIGDAWWSKRFVAVLDAITGGSRLQRGRSYARSGQVSQLVVAAGRVTAKVQGSRPKPYDVRITIAALTPAQWDKIEDALAAQALYAAALLAGEMPHEIEQVFTAVGTPLFPERSIELQSECSCPDYANPCKHVAAAYYILAERFDEDPFAIFAWRGRDRTALVAGLRARRAAEPEAVEAPAAEAVAPLSLDGFWAAGPEALALRFPPEADAVPDALIRRLGPLGRAQYVTLWIGAAYPKIARYARGRAES